MCVKYGKFGTNTEFKIFQDLKPSFRSAYFNIIDDALLCNQYIHHYKASHENIPNLNQNWHFGVFCLAADRRGKNSGLGQINSGHLATLFNKH